MIIQLEKITARKKEALKIAGRVVEVEMHNIVAIKTGQLNKSIKTSPVKKTADGFEVAIGTDLSYAKFVEKGVKGRAYNYHRNGKVVYSGVGQEFARRALENKTQEVFNIIKSA